MNATKTPRGTIHIALIAQRGRQRDSNRQRNAFLPHIGFLFDWQRWYYTNSVVFPLIFIFTRVSILIRLCCSARKALVSEHEGWSRFTARLYHQIDQLPRMILCYRSLGNKNHETEKLGRILIKPHWLNYWRERGSASGERTVLTGCQMDINLFGRRELMEVIKSDSELKCVQINGLNVQSQRTRMLKGG